MVNIFGMAKIKAKRVPTVREQQRYEKRCAVVAAVQRGDTIAVVARVFGVAVRSVFDWLSWYRHRGWDGLKEGQRQGRPAKVTAPVLRWLYRAITLGSPLQYQFEFCLWTLAIIRQMLRREQGIQLSRSAVSRLLGQLGLSPQRPLYKSYKQRPRELKRFLEKTFPGLRAQARRTGAVIFFVDEAAVRSDAHRGTTWGKIGQTPVVRESGDRFGLRLISAVSPRGDMKFASFQGAMNGEKFVGFLKKLRRDVGRPLIVIADNAAYHRSLPIREYVAQSQGELVVEHLPRYSPELNPDEQVWNQAKLDLGKRCVSTKQQMKRAVRRIMQSIQRRIELVKSFFKLPDTRYAAA